jgi:hypothetical protein
MCVRPRWIVGGFFRLGFAAIAFERIDIEKVEMVNPPRTTSPNSDHSHHRSSAAYRRRIDIDSKHTVEPRLHISITTHLIHQQRSPLPRLTASLEHHRLFRTSQPERTSMLKSATFAPNTITITVSTQKIGTTYIPTE